MVPKDAFVHSKITADVLASQIDCKDRATSEQIGVEVGVDEGLHGLLAWWVTYKWLKDIEQVLHTCLFRENLKYVEIAPNWFCGLAQHLHLLGGGWMHK